MRTGIKIEVTAADGARLEAIVANRNSPQKHVWRARIILATGDGCGTPAVMRGAGVSNPRVWRWQERFITAGVAGLLRERLRQRARKARQLKEHEKKGFTRGHHHPRLPGLPPRGR